MTTPNQPSLEEVKELLNDFSYDVDSDHGNKLLANGLSEYAEKIMVLISQAKAQGAKEEREELVKMIKSLRLNTVSSDVLQAQRNITDFLLRMLTPQKEKA